MTSQNIHFIAGKKNAFDQNIRYDELTLSSGNSNKSQRKIHKCVFCGLLQLTNISSLDTTDPCLQEMLTWQWIDIIYNEALVFTD